MNQIALWKPFQVFLPLEYWLEMHTGYNHPNALFTTLCHSNDFDDQSNLSPIVLQGDQQ
jgi:hypothetical protein